VLPVVKPPCFKTFISQAARKAGVELKDLNRGWRNPESCPHILPMLHAREGFDLEIGKGTHL